MRRQASRCRPELVREGVELRDLTTLRVGGPARYFAEVVNREAFDQVHRWAQGQGLPVLVLGEGSNVLIADEGFPGLVIRNSLRGVRCENGQVVAAGGENLPALIRWLNQQGLAGMERMYGIPGTLAGAIVGNAGAYGQEICDRVDSVRAWTPEGEERLSRNDLDFSYRHSAFKDHREWFLLECRLNFEPATGNLQAISDTILEKRQEKYPDGLRCPGSFFKNVVAGDLSDSVRQGLPSDYFFHGKVPAGKLLESVGAKGATRGGAEIAPYHGNLIINRGSATSRQIKELAFDYAERVWHRYHIRLQPEILIVDGEGKTIG